MRSLWLLCVCFALALIMSHAAGCNRSTPPTHVKASGKVVDAEGKIVPRLTIRFWPAENLESYRVGQFGINYPMAMSDDDGSFTLTMDEGTKGARPGKYFVMLTANRKAEEARIPSKYQKANSPLVVTIPNTDVSDLVLTVEP